FVVRELQRFIGHEYLERRVTVGHDRGQFLAEYGRCRIGNDKVEARIDKALALGLGVILGERLAQASALFLNAERHDQRVSAKSGRTRTGFEIVGHNNPGPARLREMNMTVDAAGKHDASGRVDRLRGFTQTLADRRYFSRANADVADLCTLG